MHRKTCLWKLVLVVLFAFAAYAPAAAQAVDFSPPTNFATGNFPQDVAVGHFNGDSDPDLAVVNQSANSVSVLLGGAGGSFSAPTDYAVGLTPLSLDVGDFNGDSDPDLAVANEGANTVSVLLGAAGWNLHRPDRLRRRHDAADRRGRRLQRRPRIRTWRS